jgi:hypothetical protein
MACGGCAAAVPSGTEEYAKLYPEKSSDHVLRLGNVVPGEWQTHLQHQKHDMHPCDGSTCCTA